jgi:diaminopimelate decarboxylase
MTLSMEGWPDSLKGVMKRFDVRGGELLVGGRTVTDLVKEHGSPLYVYDRAVLAWRRDLMRKHMPQGLEITYAVKANPMVDLLREIGPLYDGIDLASRGEMESALKAGIDAGKMSFAGPGKTLRELEFAIEKGIGTLSIEGERELEHIEAICARTGATARILIRVNPAFELSRSGLKMGGGPKQFGIDSERVPALIASFKGKKNVRFKGIHIFSGTQNLSAESILEAMEKILGYAVELQTETGVPLEILNLGGGFGIPYFKGDEALDLESLGKGLGALLATFKPKLPGTRLKIELGRYLAGECGVYLAKVLYRKISRGSVFLILDGGMHHHLPASGNISQSPIRRQMHITVATKLDKPLEKVNVVGPLCTPLDTFGLNVDMPQAEEGDIVVIPNSGAYGYSISPLGFLSHPVPKEIIV